MAPERDQCHSGAHTEAGNTEDFWENQGWSENRQEKGGCGLTLGEGGSTPNCLCCEGDVL